MIARIVIVIVATAVAACAAAPGGIGPPVAPAWPTPLPKFPSSWFGANMKSFEFQDPKELAELRKYAQVLASWPELLLSSNFSNGTAIAVEDAMRMKALLGPTTSVFTYQSMWVAAGYYDEIWALLQDDRYGGFFVQPHGSVNYTGYCSQVSQGGRDPAVTAANFPRCLGYYWNWCNDTAVDYFVNTVMRAMVADPAGEPYSFDGVFLDNSDNFHPPRGSTAAVQCNAANATLHVHIELGKMFQKFKKWPIFSFSPKPAERDAIWAAGVGFTKFYEYFTPSESSMTQLYTDTEMGLPTIVHAPTAVKRHAGVPLLGALAAFLVATGGAPHSYFQYSAANWVVDGSWKYSDLYAVDYGAALGPPTITNYGPNKTGVIWTRKFSNGATVTVNCSSWAWPANSLRGWCSGNITGGGGSGGGGAGRGQGLVQTRVIKTDDHAGQAWAKTNPATIHTLYTLSGSCRTGSRTGI